jgi:CxxC-x17-CxxC domain-containing protein
MQAGRRIYQKIAFPDGKSYASCMSNFRKPHGNETGTRPGNRPHFGRSGGRGAYGARPRKEDVQLFDAVCSTCGKKCQVPFRPNNSRPVYCKDCFGAPHDALKSKTNSFVGGGEGKSTADLTRQIAAMNAKIDAMLKILQDAASEEE